MDEEHHDRTAWEWLPLLPGQETTTASTARMIKEEAIAACLQGSGVAEKDEYVNLWELRNLALQRGGLLHAEWRKRAWPKLVAIHQQMTAPSCETESISSTDRPTVVLSRTQLQALQIDLRTTVWNVQEELRQRKLERQAEQAALDAWLEHERLRNRKVRFADDTSAQEEDEQERVVVELTPTSLSSSEEGSDAPAQFVTESSSSSSNSRFFTNTNHRGSGADSPSTVGTQEESVVSLLSLSSTATSSSTSRAIRGRKATIPEQRILYTMITNLLQRSPTTEQRETGGLKVYTYHPGLQDLVAILLFNLESPTVTSMVMNQLATHHWTPLLSSKSKLQGYLTATFMPLLEYCDGRLARHLQDQGFVQPMFCRSWLATWFASDTGNAAAASRLLDVLLVSHPLMIVYLCVAWVIHYRQRLFQLTNFVELAKTLRGLPLEATTTIPNTDNAATSAPSPNLEIVEDVIAQALQLMQRLTPSALVGLVHNLQSEHNDTMWKHVTSTIPSWLTASRGPTDWALVSNKESWNAETPQEDSTRHTKMTVRDYPVACHAVGDPAMLWSSSWTSFTSPRIKSYHWLLLLFVVLTAGTTGGALSYLNCPVAVVSPPTFLAAHRHSVKSSLFLAGRQRVDSLDTTTTATVAVVSSTDNPHAVTSHLYLQFVLTWWQQLPRVWSRWCAQQRAFWTNVWSSDEQWYMFW